LPNQPTLPEQIHQANVLVHRFEAKYYEMLHPEVQQTRTKKNNRHIKNHRQSNHKQPKSRPWRWSRHRQLNGQTVADGLLGDGNGYFVWNVRYTQKKYVAYFTGKLTVINSPIEDLSFNRDSFDLITFYSVLHHLPDYVAALRVLSGFLKKGGVMYIDHEASPSYWKTNPVALPASWKTYTSILTQ
jgi:hypothetical protein